MSTTRILFWILAWSTIAFASGAIANLLLGGMDVEDPAIKWLFMIQFGLHITLTGLIMAVAENVDWKMKPLIQST